MSYRIDHEALRALARSWGIQGRVELIRAPRKRFWGQCETDLFRDHRITLDSSACPHQAASTLAHELCHALQAEAEASFAAWMARSQEEARIPYDERPIEIEANEFADQHLNEVYTHCIKERK